MSLDPLDAAADLVEALLRRGLDARADRLLGRLIDALDAEVRSRDPAPAMFEALLRAAQEERDRSLVRVERSRP